MTEAEQERFIHIPHYGWCEAPLTPRKWEGGVKKYAPIRERHPVTMSPTRDNVAMVMAQNKYVNLTKGGTLSNFVVNDRFITEPSGVHEQFENNVRPRNGENIDEVNGGMGVIYNPVDLVRGVDLTRKQMANAFGDNQNVTSLAGFGHY